ncbi:hypothetical protein ACFXTI_018919 [Malus domestica]
MIGFRAHFQQLIPTLFSFAKLVSPICTLSFDQAFLSNIGSEGSHNTQNDPPLAPSAKQRKKEGKRVAFQAKVDELEAQNNKIAMKNEVFLEQYEKLFETLHETRHTQTRELVAPVDINHHLGAPNTEGHLPSTWVSLMRSELIIKTLINMRLLSTQMFRPEVEEVEEDTSLQKGWNDRKPLIVTAKTS